MIQADELIETGTLSRTHGKQGDLQLNCMDGRVDMLAEADPDFVILLRDGIFTPFRLDAWREKGAESYILTLHGIDTEEKAEALCPSKLYLLRRDLSEHPEEEALTLEDLIGFTVEDTQQGVIGTIQDVDESTINALFLLEDDLIIPAHDDLVEDIDYAARRITMRLSEIGII